MTPTEFFDACKSLNVKPSGTVTVKIDAPDGHEFDINGGSPSYVLTDLYGTDDPRFLQVLSLEMLKKFFLEAFVKSATKSLRKKPSNG